MWQPKLGPELWETRSQLLPQPSGPSEAELLAASRAQNEELLRKVKVSLQDC